MSENRRLLLAPVQLWLDLGEDVYPDPDLKTGYPRDWKELRIWRARVKMRRLTCRKALANPPASKYVN